MSPGPQAPTARIPAARPGRDAARRPPMARSAGNARGRRLPDFAGVALVDILANGVAMLIIVVVLSITTRMEREERLVERAEEVVTVMSHRLSTSLVLNSLAASPPARLHDYETSPLDAVYGPEILPILELHRGFVREFYSGAVWTRRALLAGANPMSAWLSGLGDAPRKRIRVDIYDVDQFYVAMSIFRDHRIPVRHWHFVPHAISLAEAARCPPGVAAKDCGEGSVLGTGEKWPELVVRDRRSSVPHGTDWPPAGLGPGLGVGRGDAGRSPGPMPGGVAAGRAGAGETGFGGRGDGFASGETPPGGGETRGRGFGSREVEPDAAAGLGGVPDRSGRSGARRGPSQRPDGTGSGGGERSMRFRIALPESVRRELEPGGRPVGPGEPSLERVLGVLLGYLRELQDTLRAGGSPSPQVGAFGVWFERALRTGTPLSGEERRIAREVAEDFAFMYRLGGPLSPLEPLAVHSVPVGAGDDAVLVVETNRRLQTVRVGRAGAPALPDSARVVLDVNAYPGIWKGLSIAIEPDSVLLMPPAPPAPPGWRAVAYVAPTLDDFIVGFVFAGVDVQGRLWAGAEDNRVRLEGRPLTTQRRESRFGARGWLVSLYGVLAAGLLAIAFAFGRRYRLSGRVA